jgi:DNA-binding beta-propeller fold protein YncE
MKRKIMNIKHFLLIVLNMVLLIIMVGCTSTVTPTVTSPAISISPTPGSYLTNSENVSSEVLLIDVEIIRGFSDKKYEVSTYPADTIVNAGEPILIVIGRIRNEHQQNKEITLYAEGYDENGKQVARTLDTPRVGGQIGLHLEYYQVGQFALHLNTAENIKSIRIIGNNYNIVPP